MNNSETHTVCNKRLQKEGGEAHCCGCRPHKDCEFIKQVTTTGYMVKDYGSTPTKEGWGKTRQNLFEFFKKHPGAIRDVIDSAYLAGLEAPKTAPSAPTKEGWRENFDKKFVVDEQAFEFEGDKMVPCEDTRLIADYIDGKTLTAAHIKDFIAKELTTQKEEMIREIERVRQKWKKCEKNCDNKEECERANHYIDTIWNPSLDEVVKSLRGKKV